MSTRFAGTLRNRGGKKVEVRSSSFFAISGRTWTEEMCAAVKKRCGGEDVQGEGELWGGKPGKNSQISQHAKMLRGSCKII